MSDQAAPRDRVKAMFQAALDRPAPDRLAFVRRACGNDRAVRREVESLLLAHERAGEFAERPAVDRLAAGSPAKATRRDNVARRPALRPGARLGPYEVADPIGEGGMGEVYRARDTKLKRQVAIKVLPASLAGDPTRLARFQREAEVLAQLNHPNVAQIHGLEDSTDVKALVLELVEGPTLADRIARGRIPVGEALPIAKQIAEALDAAHEQGIIHRDLKPANVKLRPDGTVKVLDFGLAKAMEPEAGRSPGHARPPLTTSPVMTQTGFVTGTAGYMAPEQASGGAVDQRSDIWAFGVVLYEMLTGRRRFEGVSASHVLTATLETEPDWDALPGDVPVRLRRLLHRCLEKDRRRRLHAIADARIEIDDLTEGADEPAATPVPRSGWRGSPAWPAVAMAAVLASLVFAWRVAPTEPARLTRLEVATPPDAPPRTVQEFSDVAISPDGTRVIYAAGDTGQISRLYQRQTDRLEATVLPGTHGAADPFFSPDGQRVGFLDVGTGALKQVSVLGGPATVVATVGAQTRGVSWGADGSIVFGTSRNDGLWRVPAAGGEPAPLTRVDPAGDATTHVWPAVLPNGRGVLFTAWAGSAAASTIAVVSLETGVVTDLLTGGSHPRYVPTGHILYGLDGTLFAVGFDQDRLVLTGRPVPVVEDVLTKAEGAALFGPADNGSLVYLAGRSAASARRLVWVDRSGRETPLDLPPDGYETPRLSPDGSQIAFMLLGDRDVWVADARGARSKVTTDPGRDRHPVWMPDGRRVLFGSDRDGPWGFFLKAADGTGPAVPVARIDGDQLLDIFPLNLSPDGGTLLFGSQPQRGSLGLDVLSIPEGTIDTLMDSPAAEGAGAVSPDGHWLAYISTETGRWEVYVAGFPDLSIRRKVSNTTGIEPQWSPDGTQLYYRIVGAGGAMMAVPITTEPTLAVGTPERLFDGPYVQTGPPQYDVAPDGRFLMLREEDAAARRLILVENFFEELKRLVPSG